MALRMLLRYLANNEQLVQRLAESYPVRRAAQLTAYVFFRGKAIGEQQMKRIQESEIPDRLRNEAQHQTRHISHRASTFKDKFSYEMRKGLHELNEELKRQKKQR